MVNTINNLGKGVILSCKVIPSCAVNSSNDGKCTSFIISKEEEK